MSAKVDLVIFDLAGTTIRDRGEVPEAFTSALRDARIPFDPAEIGAWRGASKREVIERLTGRLGLPSASAGQTYARFSAALRARFSATRDLAFDAAQPAFEKLKAAGVKLAANTGFDRETVSLVLSSTGWPATTFDAVVCSDDVANGRPAPDMILRAMQRTGIVDPSRVAAVGDTRLDLEAGRQAGVAYRIGVLSGAHDRATLEKAPHTHIVADVGAVPGICL